MTLSTLFGYLIGRRRAILTIADTPSALWLGLLLVLSAGLAREYDGEDLLREPWHLVLPLGASLVTSFLLFGMLWFAARKKDASNPDFARSYAKFLALYWMTAPLAWFYAIPIERWLGPVDATRFNLWLLAIVAAWRVVLISRVISVIFQASFWHGLAIVMLFADTVALVLLQLTPRPILSIMGGIRLSESEQLILDATCVTAIVAAISWPIWLVCAAVALYRRRLSRPADRTVDRRVSLPVWGIGVASLLVWVPVLPSTQAEQRLATTVENQLRRGQIERALAIMSSRKLGDFPPHWDPPPRIGYGERHPPILEVVEAVLAKDYQPWITDMFLHKLEQSADRSIGAMEFWESLDEDHFDRHLTVLGKLPPTSSFVEQHQEALELQLESDSRRSEAQKARLRALLEKRD